MMTAREAAEHWERRARNEALEVNRLRKLISVREADWDATKRRLAAVERLHTPKTFGRTLLLGQQVTETVCDHCIEYGSIGNAEWPCETAEALGLDR